MANRSFKIKIGALWLTSNGLETGRACLVDVAGADAILQAVIGNTQISNSGRPFNESPLTPTGAGRALELTILKLSADVYNSLKAILDAAATDAGAEINLQAFGQPGNFGVAVTVFHNPTYLTFGLFSNGQVKKVVVRLITTAIN